MVVLSRKAPAAKAEALVALIRGVHADLADYQELHHFLNAQFDAALRHQSDRLSEFATSITDLVETLELRRQERVAIVNDLLGRTELASMSAIFKMLADVPRQQLQSTWQILEALVNECKALNTRNGRLLMDQQEIMRRVLGEEVDIYVPS